MYSFLILLFVCCACSGDARIDNTPSGKYKISAQLLIRSAAVADYQKEIFDNTNEPDNLVQEWCSRMGSDQLINTALTNLNSSENKVQEARSKLSLRVIENTGIVGIDFYCEDSKNGIEFVNQIMEVAIETDRFERLTANDLALNFIESQIDSASNTLNQFEYQIENFKSENQILDLNTETTYFLEKINNLDGDRIKRMMYLSLLEELEVSFDDNNSIYAYILDDDEYLKKAFFDYHKLKTSTTPSNEQLKQLKNDLLTYLANTKKALQFKIAEIEKQMSVLEKQMKFIPQKSRSMVKIKREMAVAEKIYMLLLEKKANMSIARAGIVSRMIIIEAARIAKQ
jgi:uncharacterized protein involved in exopolysaccharide biosynthesis